MSSFYYDSHTRLNNILTIYKWLHHCIVILDPIPSDKIKTVTNKKYNQTQNAY